MPHFFFHVSIEFIAGHAREDSGFESQSEHRTVRLISALRPFLRNHKPQPHKAGLPEPSQPKSLGSEKNSTRTIHSPSNDHRWDYVSVDSYDMNPQNPIPAASRDSGAMSSQINKGVGTSTRGLQTKGRYEPLSQGASEAEWGIVHLYRDAQETAGLQRESAGVSSEWWYDGAQNRQSGKPFPPPKDEDCSTLCILAVPSYMTPADFLAFVGEETRNEVSHFRMIRTSRANRYMVLMKFRHGKRAREWQYEWNGKIFNSMEVCRENAIPLLTH